MILPGKEVDGQELGMDPFMLAECNPIGGRTNHRIEIQAT